MALSNGRSLLPAGVSSGGVGDGLTEVLTVLWLFRDKVVNISSRHFPDDAWTGRGACVGNPPWSGLLEVH